MQNFHSKNYQTERQKDTFNECRNTSWKAYSKYVNSPGIYIFYKFNSIPIKISSGTLPTPS